MTTPPDPPDSPDRQPHPPPAVPPPAIPLPNYTLSTVCPACSAPMTRRACKVRCDRCDFMWDCSEL